MRNKKKVKKISKPICFERLDLTFPCIFSAVYLIFVGILMIHSGTIYTYYWILLPRGALSLWSFVLLFIVFFTFLGGVTGTAILKKEACYRTSKKLTVLSLCVTTILTVLWYDSIFSAHAFFVGFIISLLMLLCMVCGLLLSLNRYRILSIGIGALVLWYLYIFWFSFCIMIIN